MLGVMGTLAYLLTPRAITSIPRFGASPSRLLQSHRSILFSSGERMPALVLVNTGMPVFAACVRTYNMKSFAWSRPWPQSRVSCTRTATPAFHVHHAHMNGGTSISCKKALFLKQVSSGIST